MDLWAFEVAYERGSLVHRRPFVGLSQPRSAPFLEPFWGIFLSKVDKPDANQLLNTPTKGLAWTPLRKTIQELPPKMPIPYSRTMPQVMQWT